MSNIYLSGLNKKPTPLGESKVAKLPEAEITVYYTQSKPLLAVEPRKKLLFENAAEKAFDPRAKSTLEALAKNVTDGSAKIERAWDASTKSAEDLAKAVRAVDKVVADALADTQKKLAIAARIAIEEARPNAGFTGPIETHVDVGLAGKVAESSEAKGAADSAADSAEARGELVDTALRLATQIENDLRSAITAAQKGSGFLDTADDDASRAVNQMKEFAKTHGPKDAVVLKATTLNLTKQLKATEDNLSDANSYLWEAQRRLGLVEKAAKPLKVPALAAELKACDAAMEKAEKPLADWMKGKSVVEAGAKPWDGKSTREYGKLALMLKALNNADIVKLLKSALETSTKLSGGIEAARTPT